MALLALTSFFWAFSFGLIAGNLADVEPTFVAAVRLALAALVMLPFLRGARVDRGHGLKLALVGAVQFGLMYELYIRSYGELGAGQGHMIALFTALIPLHVVLVENAWERRIEPRALGGALLALAGAGFLSWQMPSGTGIWNAFLLIQAANLCFASGQVAYRRLHARVPLDHRSAHALAFLGALAVALPACLVWGQPIQTARALDGPALASLLYLGLVASGLGFLFWNRGATRVPLGTLAVFNNVKAPLGVLVGLTVFGEVVPHPERLTAGALLIAAGLAFTLVGRRPRTSPPR